MASDEGRLAGKVALITGAASGMGRAVALRFAAEGAAVVAVDIDEGGLKETVAGAGGRAALAVADVADAGQVAAAVEVARSEFGGLDVAVNAAAIEREAVPLHECDDDNYDRIMAVNVRGVFLAMKHEIVAMLATGRGGAIVNIASTNSYRPQPNQPAYTASKFAVLGITKQAAIDYAPLGIRINAICPGGIDTPMLRGAIERRQRDPVDVQNRLSLMGRFGEVDEIAAAALWLCSDESSFTAGHALAVDGGYLAR
jgi:NAD(P)-dependent dehydrogenase (short-subunit alcohol dehydrogenase family)